MISNYLYSEQLVDLSEPPNCRGLGRIRHFNLETAAGWPLNPLPITPASNALAMGALSEINAEVFQNAGCNWRCWYCYVPYAQLSADARTSTWISARDMVAEYKSVDPRPPVLVLSGGQPDLIPEWIPQTMDALEELGLAATTYLWSDDNLSTDYYWRFLSAAQRDRVRGYRNYGRVGCLKGFDPHSFAFNTGASEKLYDQQFSLLSRLIGEGLDVYAYATFTSDSDAGIEVKVADFVARLRAISPQLPLRTIPLEIGRFTPVRGRLSEAEFALLDCVQQAAIEAWNAEIGRLYSAEQRAKPIAEVPL